MNTPPLVSFLVRCYTADTLRSCILSIKSQTRKDYEIAYIVPSNGSSTNDSICFICSTTKDRLRIDGKYVVVLDSDLRLITKGLVDLLWQLHLGAGPPDIVRWESPRFHSSYAIKRSLFLSSTDGCTSLKTALCPVKNLTKREDLKISYIHDKVIGSGIVC